MSCGIYKLTAPSGKFYIGSACDLARRLNSHRKAMHNGKHENRRLQGAYRKYGPLKEEILLMCRKQDLIMYEQICIDGMQPRYNQSMIAGRVEMTKETLAKMSAAGKARGFSSEHRAKITASAKTRVVSPETKARMRAWGLARTHPPKVRAKISAKARGNKRCVGRIISAETRAKMSAANTGKTFSLETRAKMSLAASRRRMEAIE